MKEGMELAKDNFSMYLDEQLLLINTTGVLLH